MINWLYITLGLIMLASGTAYILLNINLGVILGVMNLGMLIILFLRVRQILKNHEKEMNKPRESRIDEETIKTLIRLEEEKK